jgi:hypothetical protein
MKCMEVYLAWKLHVPRGAPPSSLLAWSPTKDAVCAFYYIGQCVICFHLFSVSVTFLMNRGIVRRTVQAWKIWWPAGGLAHHMCLNSYTLQMAARNARMSSIIIITEGNRQTMPKWLRKPVLFPEVIVGTILALVFIQWKRKKRLALSRARYCKKGTRVMEKP